MKRVIGLDLSLAATGVSDGLTFADVLKTKTRGHERLSWLLSAISDYYTGADLVAIEGPSYASNGGSAHERAGLWWMVTHHLATSGIPYMVVPPASRAKYATGKGNAGKDQVLAAVIRRYVHLPVDDNNAADAVILAAMGLEALGELLVVVPETHAAAMAGVKHVQPLPVVVA